MTADPGGTERAALFCLNRLARHNPEQARALCKDIDLVGDSSSARFVTLARLVSQSVMIWEGVRPQTGPQQT